MFIFRSIRAYAPSLALLVAILAGALTGFLLGDKALVLKPIGDIFLNFLLVFIVPLIFFSLAAAISQLGQSKQLVEIIGKMLLSFVFTGMVAAIYMIIVLKLYPLTHTIFVSLTPSYQAKEIHFGEQLTSLFSVTDFKALLSHSAILPLIIVSIIVGLATSKTGEHGRAFAKFLQAGSAISMQAITYIMYFAPLGFFAYFAVLIAELGPKLIENFVQAVSIYYVAAVLYFIFAFTGYAYLARKGKGILVFWKHIPIAMLTALGTCSSAASIPANLEASKKMRVPAVIYKTTIPMGAVLHKDGSVLGAVVKIAFLFGLYHLDFSGVTVLLSVLGLSLVVAAVMGAIPSGGMIGELLILSVYGLKPEALMLILPITILIDPLATMLNVTGDCVASMLVARWVKQGLPLRQNQAIKGRKVAYEENY